MRLNKKASLGDMTMVFTFLFFIFIIGVGIVAGVFIFYGSGYDSREAEASLLNYKIRECIVNNKIDNNFFKEDNFIEKCRLNKGVIEKNNIIKICKGEGACVDAEPLFFVGSNFQACLFEGAKENENYPRCSIKGFQKENEKYEIIAGSRQFSRRELT